MKWKSLYRLCALILALAAFSIVAFAATSIEEQMAANSAAWYIAKANGDEATCAALHEANVALANQAAGSSGFTSYDSSSGTWDITTSSGSRITSSGFSSGGKSTNITFTSTDPSGRISAAGSHTYGEDSINAYFGSGGTRQGLQDSYNNSANRISTTHDYGDLSITTSAADEAAVAKALLGLTDAEARMLESELEAAKQAYESADADYKEALARGDTAAAETARAMMDAAHEDSQNIRAEYGYTGDSRQVNDGGYYYDWNEKPAPAGYGGFFYLEPEQFRIMATGSDGGAITPEGTILADRGSSKIFSFAPNAGYEVSKVIVDGAEKPAGRSFAFTDIQSDHTIRVEFRPTGSVITATAGEGGAISPSGSVTVPYGEEKTFTMTPSDGYSIQDVTVDGVSMGAIETYTFRDVKESHTISATFTEQGGIRIGDILLTDTLGTDLSGKAMKSGYGFMVKVPVKAVNVTNVKVKLKYNFGADEKSVALQKSGAEYVFPVNADSPTGARCVYVPVGTPDASYTLTVEVTAKNAAGTTLSDTATAKLKILGVMYEDDFTGDS